MKINNVWSLLFSFVLLVGMASCDKAEDVIIDSSLPQGTFTVAKRGTIVEQNATGSKGAVELGTDGENAQFLKFGSDFATNLGTGTVTVYLSTSDTFTPDPANGNPDIRLVGFVTKNGEQYFKLSPNAEAKFTHVILWCGSANVPFGNAAIN